MAKRINEPEGGMVQYMGRSGAGTRKRFVAVFRKEQMERGVSALSSSAGLKEVARAREFGTAAATLGTAKGADMVVLDAINAALIDVEPDQVEQLMATAAREGSILTLRPPRLFRAIANGFETREFQQAELLEGGVPGMARAGTTLSPDYLHGMQDAIELLMQQMSTDGESALEPSRRRRQPELTWGLKATRVAMSSCTGLGVKVAILDTGLDLTHPDFQGRSIVAESFVVGQAAQDGHGHGTHCTGTACGPRTPKGRVPRYGIAYEADIYIGKVLSNSGTGYDDSVMAGIDWAVRNDCEIISMSLGSPAQEGETFDAVYESIAKNALEAGSIIIAAAGNDSERPQLIAPVGSPANCPSVLSVAALDDRQQVAFFSCAGDINVAAPGVEVLSAWPVNHGSYNSISGTSMATPHVAGIAALLCEKTGKKGQALWDALVREVRQVSLPPTDVGAGLIQAPR